MNKIPFLLSNFLVHFFVLSAENCQENMYFADIEYSDDERDYYGCMGVIENQNDYDWSQFYTSAARGEYVSDITRCRCLCSDSQPILDRCIALKSKFQKCGGTKDHHCELCPAGKLCIGKM
jgi:hypothetical protein